ncbi:MAG: hypothetical protein J6U40_03275 [Kiritimatiellae bacterium]|nr:hypothetical protein [Kiritimatiellia bacterium]MBP5226535.1 hypothetical protein [Kiritimatiellia bacterium]
MKKCLVLMVLLGTGWLRAEMDFKALYEAVASVRKDTAHTNGIEAVLETAKLSEGEDEVIARCMALYAARMAMAGDLRRFKNVSAALKNRYPDSKADRQLHASELIQNVNGKEVTNRPRATTLWGTIGKELEKMLADTVACDEAFERVKTCPLEEKIKTLETCLVDARQALPPRMENAKKMLTEAKQLLDTQKREAREKHVRTINTLQSVLPLKLRITKIKEYMKEVANTPYLHDVETLLESAEAQYVVERRKNTLIRVALSAVTIMVLIWMITFIKVNWFQTKVKSVYKPMIVPAEDDTFFDPYAEDREKEKPKPKKENTDGE